MAETLINVFGTLPSAEYFIERWGIENSRIERRTENGELRYYVYGNYPPGVTRETVMQAARESIAQGMQEPGWLQEEQRRLAGYRATQQQELLDAALAAAGGGTTGETIPGTTYTLPKTVVRWETISQGGWDYLVGYDEDGNIVSYEPLGRTEAAEMTEAERRELELQEEYYAWLREQAAAEARQAEREYAARLAAEPSKWLEYAAYTGEEPVIQPWMTPLMSEQYKAGERIPGYYPEPSGKISSFGWLPELTRPSRQYQARIGPTALEQYYGYQQARTGAMPEETQWRLWSTAPPSGTYQGLRYSR